MGTVGTLDPVGWEVGTSVGRAGSRRSRSATREPAGNGNSARGMRPNQQTSPGLYRAITGLFLLMPGTPMLFQGQEYGATSRFFYFCDHNDNLCESVNAGRAKFLAQFRSLAQSEMQRRLPQASSQETFLRSRLDPAERERNPELTALHKDVIALRRGDPVLRSPKRRGVDGAVLSADAFVLRYFGGPDGDRLLLINMGIDLQLDPAPEPLLAPLQDRTWSVLWSSESPEYGGTGTYPPDTEDNWRLPGQSALVLRPAPSKSA